MTDIMSGPHAVKTLTYTEPCEDDRGLLAERRRTVDVATGQTIKTTYRLRIVIDDEAIGKRYVHWENAEATSFPDLFSQFPTDRIQGIVQKLGEEMIKAQAEQHAAMNAAASRQTGKMPGATFQSPPSLKRRRGRG